MPFFRFSCQLCTCAFSRLFFSRPLCMLLLSRICCYSPKLSVFSVTKMKSDIVYTRAQAAILRSSGHSVKEIAKYFNKTVCWVNKWSKRECFKDKPRSGRPSVLTNCARKSIEKAKYKGAIQQGRLPRIFSRKTSKFRA